MLKSDCCGYNVFSLAKIFLYVEIILSFVTFIVIMVLTGSQYPLPLLISVEYIQLL